MRTVGPELAIGNGKSLGGCILHVFSTVPNRVIGEMVLDGGGLFSPAGIFDLHSLSLLLSSQAVHDPAAGNTI